MIRNPKVDSILKNIEFFDKTDFKLLFTQGPTVQPLPNTTAFDIENLINDTKRVLQTLKIKTELLENLSSTYIVNIDTQLNNFINHFNSISAINIGQLTNQHHQCLNHLTALNNSLRQSGLYSILTPSTDIPKLEKDLSGLKDEASIIVKEAKENAEIIRSLIPEATATSLSVALDEIAKKRQKKVNVWLTVVIMVLISSAYFSWAFLDSNEKKEKDSVLGKQVINNIDSIKLKSKLDSIAFIALNKSSFKKQLENNSENHDSNSFVYWLKRIIVFLPLFYLIVFCIKQYNKERKLLEIYVHKKVIAQTLPAYMEQAEKDEIMDEILLRGSTMIFTLPENPDSPIQGSDGIGLNEIKSILDIKEKLTK